MEVKAVQPQNKGPTIQQQCKMSAVIKAQNAGERQHMT